jgi:threonylcarbamoyladenosine tRNA methylthiotransferase MtaB
VSVDVITFGCRLNAAESHAIGQLAAEAALTNTVIINTCAVTAEAVRKAKQAVRRAAREQPEAAIIVTGCAAQIDPATFAAMPEVARVIGNGGKLRGETWQRLALPAPDTLRVTVDDVFALRETAMHLTGLVENRVRAFVQVQDGCDHRCTFCIIPFGRGNARSAAMGEVVRRVEALVEDGAPEVVLTGVDLTSWGKDLPGMPALGQLVAAILRHVPTLRRLRLSSIDPAEADPALFRAIAEEERLMPHLHLSLQAGDDMILKRMKRRHSRADAVRFCEDMRGLRPDMRFTADLIAGFPTESEDMAANTRALVEDCGLADAHVFPFSPRKGTPAARIPQIDAALVAERAAALREAAALGRARSLAAAVGSTSEVLAERGGIGRLADFTPVRLNGQPTPGAFLPVTIGGHDGERLLELTAGDRPMRNTT